MKSLFPLLFISGFILGNLFSCKKDIDAYPLPPDLLIKAGYECGWCGFDDTLTISIDSLVYTAYGGGCDNFHRDTIINDTLTKEGLTSLIMKLDLKKYFACSLNECGVCYDGCDHWIDVTANGQSHYIRYVSIESDSTLQWLEPFIYNLHEIRQKYATYGW